MGDSGSAHQVSTFSGCVDDLHTGGILQVAYTKDRPIAWSASLYRIRLRSQVYGSFLEEFPKNHGDIIYDEHYFSSTDERSVREDHPDFRGHAMGMSWILCG